METDAPPAPRNRRIRQMLIKWAILLVLAGLWLGYRRLGSTPPAPPPVVDAAGAEVKRRLDGAPLDIAVQEPCTAELVQPFHWERLDDGGGEIRLRVRSSVRNTGATAQAVGVLLALVAADRTVLAMARLDTPEIPPGSEAPLTIEPICIDPGVVRSISHWQIVLRPPQGR